MRVILNYVIAISLLLTVAVTADKGDVPLIAKNIVEKVFSEFSLDKANYEIEILSHNIKISNVEQDQLTVQPLTQREPLGLFSVKVKIWSNGELIETGQVKMRISKFANVLVATDKIKSRSIVTDELLESKRMDITTLIDKPILTHEELIGYRTRQNIRRGQILTTASFEPVPDVERGKEVQIVYTTGPFQVSATGIVLQTGMSGEYIKVRNKSSGKIVVARVVDHSAVAIDP